MTRARLSCMADRLGCCSWLQAWLPSSCLRTECAWRTGCLTVQGADTLADVQPYHAVSLVHQNQVYGQQVTRVCCQLLCALWMQASLHALVRQSAACEHICTCDQRDSVWRSVRGNCAAVRAGPEPGTWSTRNLVCHKMIYVSMCCYSRCSHADQTTRAPATVESIKKDCRRIA